MGTFGGALEARHIDASDGRLTADVTGEVETEEGVLVIRRIHVTMRLAAHEDLKETVERVHAVYAMHCPLSHVAQGDPTHFLLRICGAGVNFLRDVAAYDWAGDTGPGGPRRDLLWGHRRLALIWQALP